MNDYVIRLEKEEDYPKIEELVKNAFYDNFKGGAIEDLLIKKMRNDPHFVKNLDLIMEKNNEIIGQIVGYEHFLTLNKKEKIPILILGPVSIKKDFQNQGYGETLINFFIKNAKKLGYKAIITEGNYDYFKKFGFKKAKDYLISYHHLPINTEVSQFLALELEKDYLNNLITNYEIPQIYQYVLKEIVK